ncbi:MAG TPA: PadR family transcriptional regulator [Vicinamibacterales bacterium]|nr:PadR family transcriptional regulator [Vicinamibacterales bacterium]
MRQEPKVENEALIAILTGSLAESPLHGYGIKLDIEARTRGEISLGSGTLYQAIQRLEREGLIAEAAAGDARRGCIYRLEPRGRAALDLHLGRLSRSVDYARAQPAAVKVVSAGERIFAVLLPAYPRAFRERHAADLMAFFRQEYRHPRYGRGPLRPIRFWSATLRDLARTALAERGGFPMRPFAALAVLTLGIGASAAIFALGCLSTYRRVLLTSDRSEI